MDCLAQTGLIKQGHNQMAMTALCVALKEVS